MTRIKTEFVDPNVHLSDITVTLSEAFKQLIQICDQQYVQITNVVNKSWIKQLVSAFSRLYQSEAADMATASQSDFNFTRQIKPLIDYLLDRIKMQTSSSNKFAFFASANANVNLM